MNQFARITLLSKSNFSDSDGTDTVNAMHKLVIQCAKKNSSSIFRHLAITFDDFHGTYCSLFPDAMRDVNVDDDDEAMDATDNNLLSSSPLSPDAIIALTEEMTHLCSEVDTHCKPVDILVIDWDVEILETK